MKEIKWRWDWGCYIPFCPYCDEPAYEKDKCSFCGKEYKWVEGKHQPTVVEEGEYTAAQTTNKHIHIYKGERLVLHASCRVKKTEDELRQMVAEYEEIIMNDNGE